MRKAERFGELLAQAGMQPVETASQFGARRREIDEAAAAGSQHRADRQNRLTEAAVEAKVAQGQAAELNAELISLRSRTSSIPKRQPRPAAAALPGAAAGRGRAAVRRRADPGPPGGVRLGRCRRAPAARLRAVPAGARRALPGGVGLDQRPPPRRQAGLLPGASAAARGQAARQRRRRDRRGRQAAVRQAGDKGHRVLPLAGTRAVQPGRLRLRREHDRVPPRAARRSRWPGRSRVPAGGTRRTTAPASTTGVPTFSAGPTSRRSSALLRQAARLQERQNKLAATQRALKADLEKAIGQGQVLAGLGETREFAEIDWQTVVSRIEDLEAEKRRLEQASGELERLTRAAGDGQAGHHRGRGRAGKPPTARSAAWATRSRPPGAASTRPAACSRRPAAGRPARTSPPSPSG